MVAPFSRVLYNFSKSFNFRFDKPFQYRIIFCTKSQMTLNCFIIFDSGCNLLGIIKIDVYPRHNAFYRLRFSCWTLGNVIPRNIKSPIFLNTFKLHGKFARQCFMKFAFWEFIVPIISSSKLLGKWNSIKCSIRIKAPNRNPNELTAIRISFNYKAVLPVSANILVSLRYRRICIIFRINISCSNVQSSDN